MKSRVVEGASTYRVLVGGTGAVDGKFHFASEGQKSDFLFKINAKGFLGEQFICDGNKIERRRYLSGPASLRVWYFRA